MIKIRKQIVVIVVAIGCMFVFNGCNKKEKTISSIKESGKITVVTNATFPPFEYFDSNNKVIGIDIDISKEIAKDLGVELEILEMNFDGVIAAVASGKGDFIAAGLTVDDKKKHAIDFSNTYIQVGQSVLTLEKNKIRSIQDLKGKEIGVQIGTTSDVFFSEEIESGIFKNTDTQIEKRKEYLDLIIDLKNNRIDALGIDKLLAEQLMNKNPGLYLFDTVKEHYSLAVRKGNKDLLKSINQTIQYLYENRKIEEFYNNHTSKLFFKLDK